MDSELTSEPTIEDCNAIISAMESEAHTENKEENARPDFDPLNDQIKEQFAQLIDKPLTYSPKQLSELIKEQSAQRRKEFAQCVECGKTAGFFCERCDVQFCAVCFEPHIKSKQCVVCKEICCFDQFSEGDNEQRDECFRCFVKNQFTVLRTSVKTLNESMQRMTI